MKKAGLTPRETVMIVILAVLLIAVIYYMGFYTPLQAELATLETQITDIDTQITSFQDRLNQMNSMQLELDEIKKIPESQRSEVAPYDNLVEVLAELHDYLYANTNAYTLSLSEPEPEEDGTVRRSISLNIECDSYNSAVELVENLNGSKWRCLINSFSFSTINENVNLRRGNVHMKAEITFFELAEVTEPVEPVEPAE